MAYMAQQAPTRATASMSAGMTADVTADVTADMEAWRTFAAVHAQLSSHLARELARETGLSEADFQVLDALLDAPGNRARALDLRLTLQWEKSRLSHQVARMVTRGLIDRQACTEDARGFDVALTEAGRAAGGHARRVREASVRNIVLDTLGPERLADLADVAALLADRLARAADDDPACQAVLAEAAQRQG